MKKTKKTFALILAALLVVAMLPASVFGATYKTTAGKTVNVKFTVTKTTGVSVDKVTYSNEGLFSKVTAKVTSSGTKKVDLAKQKIYGATSGGAETITITFTCVVKNTAKPGDQCVITIGGEKGDASYKNSNFSLSNTVVIQKEKEKEEPEPKPPVDDVDRTELLATIDQAENTDRNGYTDNSWDAMQRVLNVAKSYKTTGTQEDVDAATNALKLALANLTQVNYDKLKAAIKNLHDYGKNNDELAAAEVELCDALDHGTDMLGSHDQAAVDAAADRINNALAKYQELLAKALEEKQIEVEPGYEYCNIKIHKLWPILFFISLALNIILIILLAKKKDKKEEKEAPKPVLDSDDDDDEEDD